MTKKTNTYIYKIHILYSILAPTGCHRRKNNTLGKHVGIPIHLVLGGGEGGRGNGWGGGGGASFGKGSYFDSCDTARP